MTVQSQIKHTLDNITKPVKLVIWDLDETFWKGTLSEGGIEVIPDYVDMIRTLVDRGIMCSICSKNAMEEVRPELEKLGIWDLFVFPHVDWTPKGQAIKTQIETMGLRDENVVFLDDNHMNLEEAAFFSPNLMCVDGQQDLRSLIEHEHLQGKDDSKHSRLKQYKVMEEKQSDQQSQGLTNTDFLAQSGIELRYIYDIEANWPRVLELINRTNQLNFTKKRAETPEAEAELREQLAIPGAHAGLIEVQDRYGKYGIVGFFHMVKRASGSRLEQFAFSCRTLNMGIEQYVYEALGKPDLKVVGPVANPLDMHDNVDWIAEVSEFGAGAEADSKKLCLVGGCDLLQMSFYCGPNRSEFVNVVRNGAVVRYDDVGFILNDRKASDIQAFNRRVEMWTFQEMRDFDAEIASADRIFLSLYQSAAGQHFFTFGGKEFGGKHLIHMPAQALRAVMKGDNAVWFAKTFYHRPYTLEEKLELVERAFERVRSLAQPEARIVLMGASRQHVKVPQHMEIRERFNEISARFAEMHDKVDFLDVDVVMDDEDIVSADHYTRKGYYKMAEFINAD